MLLFSLSFHLYRSLRTNSTCDSVWNKIKCTSPYNYYDYYFCCECKCVFATQCSKSITLISALQSVIVLICYMHVVSWAIKLMNRFRLQAKLHCNWQESQQQQRHDALLVQGINFNCAYWHRCWRNVELVHITAHKHCTSIHFFEFIPIFCKIIRIFEIFGIWVSRKFYGVIESTVKQLQIHLNSLISLWNKHKAF